MKSIHLPVMTAKHIINISSCSFEDDLWDTGKASWRPQWHEVFGICYSMHIDPAITKRGIINVVVKAKINIYVYLHHPGQFTNTDSKAKARQNKEII